MFPSPPLHSYSSFLKYLGLKIQAWKAEFPNAINKLNQDRLLSIKNRKNELLHFFQSKKHIATFIEHPHAKFQV